MFFRSIRFKMMLWYMLLLTLTLLAFSVVVYGSFSKTLYNDLDDLLSSKAEGVVNSINTFWSAKAAAAAQGRGGEDTFVKSAGDWVETKLKDPELMSLFVQILDSKGARIVASKNMPHIETLSKDVLEDLLDGEDDFDTLKGETAEGKSTKFRTYTRPVMIGGKVEYIVQVSGSIGLLALATKNLVWLLVILLPLTVFLAGMPGLVLVRLTLKPVDTMIKALRQTTAENLKLKIHLPDTKDEIKRLADTFNEMIERLDRSFSSQQSFIQDLSSELKNPLTELKEQYEAALGSSASAQEYASLVRHGLEEMKKFGQAIEELETLAKFDNNRMALEIRKVNLSPLIDEALGAIRAQASAKDIALSSILKDTMIIDGDERQLKALFANILDNAIKYTNRKGSVTVTARKNHRSVTVSISDTGIGIEENELPYIFDRFYQVTKSRSGKGGFGLGLSIAKSVAEVHKATIAVDSTPGKGSTFTVSLPLSYPG